MRVAVPIQNQERRSMGGTTPSCPFTRVTGEVGTLATTHLRAKRRTGGAASEDDTSKSRYVD